MPYNSISSRAEMATELPRAIQEQIIGDIQTQSTLLSLGRSVPVTTRDSRIPVLTDVPEAYWIESDTGLKQTSKAVFTNTNITAEEIAVILPIPDSVIEDSEFGLFDAIMPLVSRAFARRIDAAALFGIDKPASWGVDLFTAALAAGQMVASTADSVADLLGAAELVATDEYRPSGAVVRVGWEFAAGRARTDSFTANPIGKAGSPFPWSVGGLPIRTSPVFWDRTAAEALVADWSMVIYGVRRELKFEFFNSGVLTDAAGNVTVNLLQQDLTALRATMRIAYLLAAPATASGTSGVPVAAVLPTGSAYDS